jgi:hypothetical protein
VHIRGVAGAEYKWCDGGLWGTGADVFNGQQFDVSGFNAAGYGVSSGPTIKIQNVDDEFGKKILDADLSVVRVTLYIADGAAQDVSDLEHLGEWAVGGVTIDLTSVAMSLQPILRYAPRRVVSPAHGFLYATPIGTRIQWGGEIYTLGD